MIYKYNNRKLYDKERSRFTTLNELEVDIKNNRTIEVRDMNENDITNEILLNILSNRNRLNLTNEYIHDLIRKA